MDGQQALVCSRGINPLVCSRVIQCSGINHNEKNIKNNVNMCISESLYCTAEINTT